MRCFFIQLMMNHGRMAGWYFGSLLRSPRNLKRTSPPRFSFHACVTTLNNGFCICMQDSFVKIYNLDILISTPECLTLSPRVPPPNTVNFSLFAVCVFAEWAPAGPTICTGRSSKKFKNISEPANKSPAKGWKDRRADVMHAMAKQKAYSFFLVCPLIFLAPSCGHQEIWNAWICFAVFRGVVYPPVRHSFAFFFFFLFLFYVLLW